MYMTGDAESNIFRQMVQNTKRNRNGRECRLKLKWRIRCQLLLYVVWNVTTAVIAQPTSADVRFEIESIVDVWVCVLCGRCENGAKILEICNRRDHAMHASGHLEFRRRTHNEMSAFYVGRSQMRLIGSEKELFGIFECVATQFLFGANIDRKILTQIPESAAIRKITTRLTPFLAQNIVRFRWFCAEIAFTNSNW